MIRRKLKNVIKNYTECEILVREATSNEAWGPSNSILSKIAELSNDDSNILQIMPLLWKRLKDKGRKWRHVYKSLLLMVFLVTRGNIVIADHCRKNIHFIQSLEDFTYTEDNVDVGSRIRKRANELSTLLKDNDMLKSERQKALLTDMRFSKDVVSQGSNVPIKYGNGVGSLSQGPSTGSFISTPDNKDAVKVDYPVPSTSVEEDIQLQIALAESKEEAERLQKTDEIVQLTDKYKLDLAIEKNLKENSFDSEFDCGLWNQDEEEEDNIVATETFNDPWSPEPAKKAIVIDPWSQNVASNESLWSRGTKPVTLDPWTMATDSCKEDNTCWSTNNVTLDRADTDRSNPWPQLRSPHSTSPHELDYNPWSQPSQISANPIQHRDETVTTFLANHSHLVNIDTLLTAEQRQQRQQKRNQNNPFLNATGGGAQNPFLVAERQILPLAAENSWPPSNNALSQATTEANNNSHVKSLHYNPFLS